MKNLGKQGKDKITGFEGIIVSKIEYLFGCAQYGIAPPVYDNDKQKRGETEYFDEGRIEIIGVGVTAKSVKVKKPGADFNKDAPRH